MARGREDRKYLISAESRKSQHKAFCVIKPLPQKLYGYTKRSFPLYSSPGERVMVPLGNANRNAGTRKAEKKINKNAHTVCAILYSPFYLFRRCISRAVSTSAVSSTATFPIPFATFTPSSPSLTYSESKTDYKRRKSFRTILIRFQNRVHRDTPLFIDRRLAERINVM